MTYFNFPHIEEDDNLKNLRNDVKSFLKTTFNSNNFKPQADAWMYSANPEFSKKLGEKGWLGMSFPKKYGGREKTMLERYVITEELLVAGAPVAAHWIADRQSGSQIIRYGTEKQKKEIIPKISSGECFFAIGMREPDSGSDLASVKTFAKKTADGWELTGRKIWSTGAHLSHYMIVLARTEKLDEKNRHSGLSQFLVNLKLPGVDIKPYQDASYDIAKFDLSLFMSEVGDELVGSFNYCTDLFTEDTISRLARNFDRLLESFVENSSTKVKDLRLLTDERRKQILIDWNDTASPYPKDKTIYQLFEDQVNKTPDNIAVIFEDQKLSYKDLNKKSNQLNMLNQIPNFYESIVEANNRGELWGIEKSSIDSIQLEIDFNIDND